jgi:motility quorum-sensing regulator / GCU-specific mRNA interferase toxin
MMRGVPTYDLRLVQQLVGQGTISRRISGAALRGAAVHGFDDQDVVAAVLALAPTDFYKSMEAEKSPGLWQDVYHSMFKGVALYIKLQIAADGRAVVVQCKQK